MAFVKSRLEREIIQANTLTDSSLWVGVSIGDSNSHGNLCSGKVKEI